MSKDCYNMCQFFLTIVLKAVRKIRRRSFLIKLSKQVGSNIFNYNEKYVADDKDI